MKYQKAAFSFVELIIIVSILAIFTVIAVPRFNYAIISRQKVDTTARKIVTDLRLTRRLAISDAANNSKGFELKMVGSVPYDSYEIENVDTKATIASHTLDSDLTINNPTGTRFIFGPLGNLETGSATQMIISAEGRSFTITINSATGTIKCIEN
ncbi:MAG: pilus assembly FimT family protein [Planctomycetota bacterium]|jgi:Tfp pilus assembly protein FimT